MSGDTLANCNYSIKEGKTSLVLLNVFKHLRLKNEKKKKKKHSKLFIKIQFTCFCVCMLGLKVKSSAYSKCW